MIFADVIVDISLRRLDRTFQYRVPDALADRIGPGVCVEVPFGARKTTGYVLSVGGVPKIEEDRIREILSVPEKAMTIDGELVALASWMKDTYGGTMNQALKTVLPVRRRVKKGTARKEMVPDLPEPDGKKPELNPAQQEAVSSILAAYPKPSLIFGVTGSGKTEVYMALIEEMIARGRQSILLIPEIALTYQNVGRFTRRFGRRVGIVNSRLSAGEKADAFQKAENGELDVMIGPRSALFTPFPKLGMILIDEEHEGTYRSEQVPRYHAVDTAEERARLAGACLVLGSATPSLESYTKAVTGEYALYRLPDRAVGGSTLPEVSIVDMRRELREGNRSVFSRELYGLIEQRLAAGEQTMLFLNRRGYSGHVSCRSCGAVIRCPHCDVALTAHQDRTLNCHYCGYRIPMPEKCPACGSPYIAGFGTGTQKIESLVKKSFPRARVLRMDLDTTARKNDHARLLSAFAAGEADILIGTQMIVKGHDFPKVTLMGVLAADLSLYGNDFRSTERTFQLLTQAAGRAGRSAARGRVVIQTYSPENFGIRTAARQDYPAFYEREYAYRSLMHYPPAGAMMSVLITAPDNEEADRKAGQLAEEIDGRIRGTSVVRIGPSRAGVSRIKDVCRQMIYLKAPDRESLRKLREELEEGAGAGMVFDLL